MFKTCKLAPRPACMCMQAHKLACMRLCSLSAWATRCDQIIGGTVPAAPSVLSLLWPCNIPPQLCLLTLLVCRFARTLAFHETFYSVLCLPQQIHAHHPYRHPLQLAVEAGEAKKKAKEQVFEVRGWAGLA